MPVDSEQWDRQVPGASEVNISVFRDKVDFDFGTFCQSYGRFRRFRRLATDEDVCLHVIPCSQNVRKILTMPMVEGAIKRLE